MKKAPNSVLPSLTNGARYTNIGLTLPPDLSLSDWEAVGASLLNLERGINWGIGDWLNYGEPRYGAKYKEAVAATGRDVQTLMNVAWVASRFDLSRRRESLSWSHHAEVAAMEPADADRLLAEAEAQGWSRRALREAVQGTRALSSGPKEMKTPIPELNQRIASGVKRVRTMAGLSQREFSQEIYGEPTHQGTISRIENARQRPNLATLHKMTEAFKVPMAYFGVDDGPSLPAGLVQTAAHEAIVALDSNQTKRARQIMERIATALVDADLQI